LDFLNDTIVQEKENKEIPGTKFNLFEDLGKHYYKWMIFAITQQKITDVKKLAFLKQELEYVMTGDKSYVSKKQSETFKKVNKKRRFLGYGNHQPKSKR